MRKSLLVLSILPLLACTYGRGEYKSALTEPAPGRLVLKLSSRNATSDADVKRTLLERAARATIDRGAIWLRVEELAVGPMSRVYERSTDVFDDPNRPKSDIAPADVQQALDAVQSVEITRIRDGSITFSISREPFEIGRVFDAAKLLDDLRAGKMPPL